MYLQYQHEVGDVQSVTNYFRKYSEVFGTICDSDTVSSKIDTITHGLRGLI